MRVLILSFFLFPTIISSQQEFAPVGAKWEYCFASYNQWIKGKKIIRATEIVEFSGKECTKLEIETIKKGLPEPMPDTTCCDTYYVYQSGDTIFYAHPWLDDFEILYNFELEIGDTLLKEDLFFDEAEHGYLVDSIKIENYNNQNLKRFYVKNICNNLNGTFCDNNSILEKIGFTDIFFFQQAIYCACQISGDNAYLYAYEDPNFELIEFHTPCDLTHETSVNDENKPPFFIKIHPNPATTDISLIVNSEYPLNGKIKILNVDGKILKELNYGNEDSIEISIEELPSGLYFLEFQTKNQSNVQQIIKY